MIVELTARQRLQLACLLGAGIAPFYFNGVYNAWLAAHHREWFWRFEVAAWIALPAVILSIAGGRRLVSCRDLGLTADVRGRRRPLEFLALLAVIVPVFIWMEISIDRWAFASLPQGWPHPSFAYAQVVPPAGPETGWLRLLALLHLSVTAGVVEEIYYRAAFDRLFPRNRPGAAAYVIASSLVFAGAHWEGGLPAVVVALSMGIFGAIVFRSTGNLWPLLIGHVAVDWYWFASGSG